jgi:NAD(P)-dependent dehydrogenase (short-subunit alcohol dehydrogenase family)
VQINGSTALVTGANRGLGKCFVDTLIARGATRVYAGARDTASLQPLIQAHGDAVVAVALDVTDDASVSTAAESAGDVTILVNNAGVLERQGLIEAGDLTPLRHELDVNLLGMARMCLAFAPILGKSGASAIVNMLSVASLHGFAPFGTYCVSKAAAMSLTQSMRHELHEQGTTVHGVYAGFIATDMTEGIKDDMATPEDIATETMDGLQAGLLDIDTGERAHAVRELIKSADSHTIEQAYHDRAVEHYQNYGKGKA